jgi:hypothetical protein
MKIKKYFPMIGACSLLACVGSLGLFFGAEAAVMYPEGQRMIRDVSILMFLASVGGIVIAMRE